MIAGLLGVSLLGGRPRAGAADLSGLYADAMAQDWPAGRTPVGAGTASLGDPHVLTAAHVIAGCHHIGVSRAAAIRPATLVGLDSRLDLALLSDTVAGGVAGAALAGVPQGGSALAGAMQAGEGQQARLQGLHVMGFGQPGHATREAVRVAVQSPGVVQGMAETPLLALTGPLVAGTSGSPVLDQDGRSIGMVVGQVRADRTRSVGVRSVDLLRFLAYFGLDAVRPPSGNPVAQAVLVQCVD